MIEQVKKIAQQAGDVLMQIYNEADFEIETKADSSPVTKADKASNAFICNALEALSPHIPIISEERPLPPFAERTQYKQYWLIDPLDGTKEFIQRNGEFAINIALIENNQSVLGVCYLPAVETLYWAAKGTGAWKQIGNSDAMRIKTDTFDLTQSGLAIAVTRSHFNQATADFVGNFTFPRLIAKGSALKMLWIAEGKAHLHPRFGTTMEWDTAAPQIIVEEAGGKILHLDGTPLRYNKAALENPNYIVYGKCKEIWK
jgi:3'(2'), 5'-bisphosphate nucleotidase